MMNTSQKLSNNELHDLLEDNWGDWEELFKIIEDNNLTIEEDHYLHDDNYKRLLYIGDDDYLVDLFLDYYNFWKKHTSSISTSIKQSGFIDLRC